MVSLFGFKFKITEFAIVAIGLSFPFLFVSNMKLRNIAEAMIGFGILFIGLDFIKDSVPSVSENPEMFEFLNRYTDFGFASLLLFVAVGTVLTLLTQSSSAATAITLVMLVQGWVSFPIAAAMILGENIGTTVTANIAALIGNVHAKRAARFHFFFNMIGVFWMLLIITPFLQGMDKIIMHFTGSELSVFSDDPDARTNATLALSLFHTSFNVLNVALIFAFVPLLIRLVEYIQPDKGGSDEQFRLEFISAGLMSSSELSIEQAKKEVALFTRLVEKIHYSFTGLLYKEKAKRVKFLKKIAKREEITDRLEIEIAEYLVKVSENGSLSADAVRRVRSIQSMINDLERIGDLYFQMSKTFERLMESEEELPEDSLEELREMLDAVHDAIIVMKDNVAAPTIKVDLNKAIELENRIDLLRNTLRNHHYQRLEDGRYTVQTGIVYLDILNRLEKIGDHVINVSEAASGKTMKQIRSQG
jgi:phosphate:Na+ symporter